MRWLPNFFGRGLPLLMWGLLGIGSVGAEVAPQGIERDTDGAFISFVSSSYALVFAKDAPKWSYLGLESGGRSRRLLDKSLLIPGEGGILGEGLGLLSGEMAEARIEGDAVRYAAVPRVDGGTVDLGMQALDARTFALEISSEVPMEGEIYTVSTAPEIAPVNVWAESSARVPSDRYDRPEDFYHPRVSKASFKLPAVLHFPDYGLVKVEAVTGNVFLQMHLVPDDRVAGLTFGPFNRGPHSGFRAFHRGSIVLSFHTLGPTERVRLRFTVLDEHFPEIPGCDFSDARFDGLKRCWQNAFPVNPEQQCMGDNLLLPGIGHLSMAFKADMLVFTPDLPVGESMIDALRRALEATLRDRVDAGGRIRDYGWESSEVFLIALYDYLLITGDWAFIERYEPILKRVVRGVLETDRDGDGIFESPFHGNRFEEDRESLNWWDDFAFGHKDAYVNLMAYRALSGMREVYAAMREETERGTVDRALKRFEAAFHPTFFNPETGFYAGWISADGKIHDYGFTFVNGMAIYLGLVDPVAGRGILERLINLLEEEGYDFVYGVPGPSMEVLPADRQGWDEMARWGRYENGGLCGQTAYHFLQALYAVGMREKADEILFKMLATFEREPTHSGLFPGYLQSVDWRTKGGAPTGYNYLADNYYFLLAAITGHYGVAFPNLPSRP